MLSRHEHPKLLFIPAIFLACSALSASFQKRRPHSLGPTHRRGPAHNIGRKAAETMVPERMRPVRIPPGQPPACRFRGVRGKGPTRQQGPGICRPGFRGGRHGVACPAVLWCKMAGKDSLTARAAWRRVFRTPFAGGLLPLIPGLPAAETRTGRTNSDTNTKGAGKNQPPWRMYGNN